MSGTAAKNIDKGALPNAEGHFGTFGGSYVPETLVTALKNLGEEYERAKADPGFKAEL
ncbi:MAG: tryptophan synthase subunit beta, partial [Opitutales bacterium]|nr:tryptophan synthase subunit beta [Opitutales bacterium]